MRVALRSSFGNRPVAYHRKGHTMWQASGERWYVYEGTLECTEGMPPHIAFVVGKQAAIDFIDARTSKEGK